MWAYTWLRDLCRSNISFLGFSAMPLRTGLGGALCLQWPWPPTKKRKKICSLVKAVKDMAPRYYIFDAITLHSCVWGQYRKLALPVAEGTIFLAKELLKTSINDFQFRIFVFVILLFICRLSLFHLTSCSIAWLFYFFVLKNVFLYSIL